AAGRARDGGAAPGDSVRDRSRRQTAHRRGPMGFRLGGGAGALERPRQRHVQGFRTLYRGRLEVMDGRAIRAIRPAGDRLVRCGPLHVRLGLAGLLAGRLLRAGRDHDATARRRRRPDHGRYGGEGLRADLALQFWTQPRDPPSSVLLTSAALGQQSIDMIARWMPWTSCLKTARFAASRAWRLPLSSAAIRWSSSGSMSRKPCLSV